MTATPAPRRASGLAVGALAALVAAALTVTALRDDPVTPPATAAPSVTPAAATPEPEPTIPATPSPEPVRAPVTHAVRGRAVVVSGDGGAAVVDLRTGRRHDVRVPDRVVHAVAVRGAVALLTERTGEAPGPVYVLTPGLKVRRLPELAATVRPAPGGLWVSTFRARKPVVIRYAVDGRVLTGPVELPGEHDVVGAYDGGLVLRAAERHDVALWDPGRGSIGSRRQDVTFLDAVGDRVVWTAAECATACPVRWLDLPSQRPAPALPVGMAATSGALSPDGRWLALRAGWSTGPGGSSSTATSGIVVSRRTTSR